MTSAPLGASSIVAHGGLLAVTPGVAAGVTKISGHFA